MTHITFHGGAGTVTGSKHLIEHGGTSALIDCGLFQGRKELRLRNWEAPGFDPRTVGAVLLTHAHIDHSGYLPRLVKDGFAGPVYATPATADLVDLLLRDSAMIQEEDAAYANRKGFSKHSPALPLYTVADAERAIAKIEVVTFDEWASLGPGVRFRFVPTGHILGSGLVELQLEDGPRIVFSGDIGRYDAPLVPDPTPPPPCDALVIESTYGDRKHPETSIQEQLRDLLTAARSTGGTVLIPSFAVGRAQQLLVLLNEVMQNDPTLALPIHLDSPMAVDTTKIYGRYPEESGLEELDLRSGSSRTYGPNVYLHRTRDESMRLNELTGPRVIVSSSGMLTGGRVLHHLRRLLPESRNRIVLAGYQAPGTRGWRLQRGERHLRMHGRDVPVRAGLASISGLSAHADQDQLVRWVRDLTPPRLTVVVHGEVEAAATLARRLSDELGFECKVPGLGDGYML
jgi:metallo-beta-lactamase family protein